MSNHNVRPREVSFPLRWHPDEAGDYVLTAGPLLVGMVFWLDANDRKWSARGQNNVCTHRSDGHATYEAAQEALENAVLALAGSQP